MDRRINQKLSELKMRRSPHIVIYFHRGKLIFENYAVRRVFRANASTLLLLSHFSRWTTVSEIASKLREYSEGSILHSARNLLQHGLLITRGSDQDILERKFGKAWLWPIASRYYHFSTKIDEQFPTPSEVRRYYEKTLKGRKQPVIYKSYTGRPKVRLPHPSIPQASLFEALRRRVTTREFSGSAITFKQLSNILYYTWGKISTYETREFGRLLHKTSPSAGARHPIEAYAVVNRVEGIRPGIYHYSVRDHSLELVRSGDFKELCVAFSAGQKWTEKASVLFLMTAVVSRTAWKYRTPRVYRAFLLDAGHLSQSFLLVCTSLGLAAFSIGIMSEVAIEREIGLDGVNETAIFVVGVGQRTKQVVSKKRTSIPTNLDQ